MEPLLIVTKVKNVDNELESMKRLKLTNIYRTHHCGELRGDNLGESVTLSGWIHNKRDHGNLLFIDLRDRWGVTQCVIDADNEYFQLLEKVRLESVLRLDGKVSKRVEGTENPNLSTGEIEVMIQNIFVESIAGVLPFQINTSDPVGEDIRLKYRYLDLRRKKLYSNVVLRSEVINAIRFEMLKQDFIEIQTPILTASSPEGARDFLVPSRLQPGKFYALPQAPQQFKQLLMVAGFERYFQIACSFRDEDARADRSPGEFYQFDMEMSFCTQEDVFQVLEGVLFNVFHKFSQGKIVQPAPFPRITYNDAMNVYGSDKPDLRNPLRISDVTDAFRSSGFELFAKLVEQGALVKAICAPSSAGKPRSFFDGLNEWARNEDLGGLGYIIYTEDGAHKGPITKNLDESTLDQIREVVGARNGDSVFFIAEDARQVAKLAGKAREKICDELGLRENSAFRFCWVVDFPMFEEDEDTGKIDFSHNPFSMPQGEMDALNNLDPLEIKAYQYDIVCNGIELSSGAIRNHKPEIMYKAFEIAGYTQKEVDEKFSGMINAFKFGAPPHGGCAPGIDRILMLLAEEENIREVITFPMNQQAEDLMMNAPAQVSDAQLKELKIHFHPDAKHSK